MQPCNCYSEINAKLKEKNLHMSGYAFQFTTGLSIASIETEWRDDALAPKGKKKSPPKMYASHCPFCGFAYADMKDQQNDGPCAQTQPSSNP